MMENPAFGFSENHKARDMPEAEVVPDNCKLLDFLAIKSDVEKTAGKFFSTVSRFFTGCKRLTMRHQVAGYKRQRTEDRKQKMRSGESGKLGSWKARKLISS